MARRKKGKRRGGRRRKKGAPKSDRAMPLGASVGLGVSALEVATGTSKYSSSPLGYLLQPSVPMATRIANVSNSLKAEAVNFDNYKFGLAGVVLSASPKVPILRMAAKPVDRVVRRVSKGKVSL